MYDDAVSMMLMMMTLFSFFSLFHLLSVNSFYSTLLVIMSFFSQVQWEQQQKRKREQNFFHISPRFFLFSPVFATVMMTMPGKDGIIAAMARAAVKLKSSKR